MFKESLKWLVKKIPVAFTKNQKYDKWTTQIMQRVCKENSNCIDIGCHKGEILDLMLTCAPAGFHYGFEPIPFLADKLASDFSNKRCEIHKIALSDKKGTSTFNLVLSNPAYSGLRKRKYDRAHEEDQSIEVATDRLDNVIDSKQTKIDLIKIDVEGAEFMVLSGAKELLKAQKPVVVFEHGLGASDFYDAGPADLYALFEDCGMSIYLMNDWLKAKEPLDLVAFEKQYHEKLNYYFLAC